MINLKQADVTPGMDSAFLEMRRVINDHMNEVTPIEMMAILANLIGSIIGGSQTNLSASELTELVNGNLMNGYRDVQDYLTQNHKAGNA